MDKGESSLLDDSDDDFSLDSKNGLDESSDSLPQVELYSTPQKTKTAELQPQLPPSLSDMNAQTGPSLSSQQPHGNPPGGGAQSCKQEGSSSASTPQAPPTDHTPSDSHLQTRASEQSPSGPPLPPVLPTSLSLLKRLQCQRQEKASILAAKTKRISEGLQIKTIRDETVGLTMQLCMFGD